MRWLAGTLLLLTACRDSLPPPADEYVVACSQVNPGLLCASDQYFIAIADAEAAGRAKPDACLSPSLLSPSSGGVLDPSAPPTISFNRVHATCAVPRWEPRPLRSRNASAWSSLGDWLEPAAFAHALPAFGENYLLRIRLSSSGEPLYTVELSTALFTPDGSKWSRALSSYRGQLVELTIERAVFTRDVLSEGPYAQPSPWIFSVAP